MSQDLQESEQATPLSFALLCGITILLGAFLLFQVQPVISKMILPWFGGTPAVWSTCMLFFQVFLLAGYTYAHFINSANEKTVRIVHIALIAVAICLLPINPSENWKPADGSNPAWNILLLLTVKVGLPYLLLATTAPLVQTWFGRTYPNMSPYRLYALSNFGSLSALLTYPVFFEPRYTTIWQGRMWSIGFILYGFLIVTLLIKLPQKPLQQEKSDEKDAEEAEVRPARLNPLFVLLWIILPALASVMLLVVTHHISEDVAVAPFMWIVPLSLYLITFIICFDHERWYLRRTFAALAFLSILAITHGEKFMEDRLQMRSAKVDKEIKTRIAEYKLKPVGGGIIGDARAADDLRKSDKSFAALEKKKTYYDEWDYFVKDNVWLEAILYFAALFFICMVCHGELVRCKPPVKYLTAFYLSVSAGGALGGVFAALICPQIFDVYAELAYGFVASYAVAVIVFGLVCIFTWIKWTVPSDEDRLALERILDDNHKASIASWNLISHAATFVAAAVYAYIFWNIDEVNGFLRLLVVPPAIYFGTQLLGWALFKVGKAELPAGLNALLNAPTVLGVTRLVAIGSHIVVAGLGVGMFFHVWNKQEKIVLLQRNEKEILHMDRNFYGVLSVRQEDMQSPAHRKILYHGTIIHGSQLVDKTRNMEPNSYYVESSGVGIALRSFPNRKLHVGVIGLGTGTLVVYGRNEDRYRYYEINPLVKEICLKFFTYISQARDRGTKVKIVMGDARLSMEREVTNPKTKDDKMDVIVLDAFRSDAIPAHLITKEAFETYIARLKSDGIIAIHISNRYLDLRPVVQGLADHFKWSAMEVDHSDSTWVLFTNNQQFLSSPEILTHGTPVSNVMKQDKTKPILWTDQFSNLLGILRGWGRDW